MHFKKLFDNKYNTKELEKIWYEDNFDKKYHLQYGYYSFSVKNKHWCKSHQFWFDDEKETKKLYNGIPNIFTDNSFDAEGFGNFYKKGCIFFGKRFQKKGTSILKAVRSVIKNRVGLDEHDEITIENRFYLDLKEETGKNYSFAVNVKIHPNHVIQPSVDYEVNGSYLTIPNSKDESFNERVLFLRENGFLCSVFEDLDYSTNKCHNSCIAYGMNTKIGFSDFDNDLLGYHYGKEDILFDKYGCFDKWSRAENLSKSTNNLDLLEIISTFEYEK